MKLSIDEILARHLEDGWTFARIGAAAGVSGERIRQVVRRAGVHPSRSRDIRRDHDYVVWTCRGCGAEHKTAPSGARSYCRASCRKRNPETFDAVGAARWNDHDGHYWIRHPVDGKKVRVERYLAERKLGRPLESTEWVVLLDGNPSNLHDSNIAVMSPKEAHAFYRKGGRVA